MGLAQTIIDYLTQPRRISGVNNQYYIARKGIPLNKPIHISNLFAEKALTGSWSLYEVTQIHDDQWEQPEKIASGLTGKEAFERVRDHELQPERRRLPKKAADKIRADETFVLKQERPDTATYWRNLEI
jgi:hypothetical protein